MKIIKILFLINLFFFSCKAIKKPSNNDKTINSEQPKPIKVAGFQGEQVTGVTIDNMGGIYVNFPRWRPNIRLSVAKLNTQGKPIPFPDAKWNSWKINEPLDVNKFVSVQSVVANQNNLYVIDTRRPVFGEILDAPRVFVFDLVSKQLKETIIFKDNTYHSDSYINDIRVDNERKTAYFTDSGHAGLIAIDLTTGKQKRVLNNHKSTLAEQDYLNVHGIKWEGKIHSDGIAFDKKESKLYYHSLTGYNLYAIPVDVLLKGSNSEIENAVEMVSKTTAPDGMIFDKKGNLYFADLEQDKIYKLESNGKQTVIAEGKSVKWADTFSIYNGDLYYTNSRISEAMRPNISDLEFTVYKVKL